MMPFEKKVTRRGPVRTQSKVGRTISRTEPAVARVHVKWAVGPERCAIEISPEPVGDATWAQVEGNGCRRALAGYAPGTYWVRAASVRSTGKSAWCGPVAVIVK